MSLSDEFYRLFGELEEHPEIAADLAEMVFAARPDAESDGLLALLYHEGIGVETDFDKAFEHAERAAAEDEGSALYLLGHMCHNAETPDQATGGARQKYDHYDAAGFIERCAATDSRWAVPAHLWLGDHYMDSARGGDPEVAVGHYEAIGHDDAEAAGKLSDYYWELLPDDLYVPDDERDRGLEAKVYEWTSEAVRLNPHDFSYRMGWCCADGIGCRPSFRLARKYFEDAYEFGDGRAAETIALLYEDRLADHELTEQEREHCTRCMESWRRLASKSEERENKTDKAG